MIGRHDRELEERLSELRAPDEAAAEERSWNVIREAYEQRTPVRPSRGQRRLGVALAGGLAVIAVGLSPAGAKVGDLVSDVVGITGEDAKPELRTLPAAGELLVESNAGVWLVRDDGSKRLLGDYEEAAWSPNGRFVAVAEGSELLALNPVGEVQWSIQTAGEPRDLAWEGTEFNTRIAYRAGGDLHVVGGDGVGERLVARDVASTPVVWTERPAVSKVSPPTPGSFGFLVGYLDSSSELHLVDPDTGAEVEAFGSLAASLRRQLAQGAVRSPTGEALAELRRDDGRSTLTVAEGARKRVVFSGAGRITDPVWSPDGRWLLFGWRDADQWVFIQPEHPRQVEGILRISRQFDPDEEGQAGFPRVAGWTLPER